MSSELVSPPPRRVRSKGLYGGGDIPAAPDENRARRPAKLTTRWWREIGEGRRRVVERDGVGYTDPPIPVVHRRCRHLDVQGRPAPCLTAVGDRAHMGSRVDRSGSGRRWMDLRRGARFQRQTPRLPSRTSVDGGDQRDGLTSTGSGLIRRWMISRRAVLVRRTAQVLGEGVGTG